MAELPENWDQTKDDTQSLFLNKSDKNDLEPYPLALSEEGNELKLQHFQNILTQKQLKKQEKYLSLQI